MNKIFGLIIAFVLVGTALCLGPGVKVAIKQKTIEAIKDQILPIIMRNMKEIRVNDIEGDVGPIHYKVHDIKASIGNLPAGNVHINLIGGSNRVAIRVDGINGGGHARIDYRLLFIQDGFNADASIHNVGLSTTLAFEYDGEGRPKCTIVQFDIGINAGNVDLHFSGNILAGLLEFIANLLKPMFVDMMRNMINQQVPPQMNTMINNLIRTLPMTIDIGPNMAITFRLPQNPWVNADYFCVAIAGYIYYKGKPGPPPYNPPPCPDYDASSQKGIQFFLTDYVIRSSLDAAFGTNLMNIQYSMQVNEYTLNFDCAAIAPPVLAFDGSIAVNAKGKCSINGVNTKTGEKVSFGIITDVVTDIKEKIKAQILFFEIVKLAVANMVIDNPNKHDLKWFEDALNFILAKTAEVINALLGQRGIKLPTIEGIDYSDIEESVKKGYIEALVTPIIHIKESTLTQELSDN